LLLPSKKETGMTLTEFVLQKRLAKVSAILAEGCTLATAATEAGFVNYSHFYKIFVARKGISPQKYYFAK
jgi:two-component system response regulator YesN